MFNQESRGEDVPGGLVVKNPPANTGDTGLVPGEDSTCLVGAT